MFGVVLSVSPIVSHMCWMGRSDVIFVTSLIDVHAKDYSVVTVLSFEEKYLKMTIMAEALNNESRE